MEEKLKFEQIMKIGNGTNLNDAQANFTKMLLEESSLIRRTWYQEIKQEFLDSKNQVKESDYSGIKYTYVTTLKLSFGNVTKN